MQRPVPDSYADCRGDEQTYDDEETPRRPPRRTRDNDDVGCGERNDRELPEARQYRRSRESFELGETQAGNFDDASVFGQRAEVVADGGRINEDVAAAVRKLQFVGCVVVPPLGANHQSAASYRLAVEEYVYALSSG